MNKPFNLAEALAGKPVVSKGGEKVAFIADTKQPLMTQPIIVVFERENFTRQYSRDGRYYPNDTSYRDLFMAPVTNTKYVNLYVRTAKGSPYYFAGGVSDTAEDAAREVMKAGSNSFTFVKTLTTEVEE